MNMLVFALLIIGMLGIYTQVLAVQTARLFAGQTSLADSIILWHEAAASLAGGVVNPITTPMGIAGCSLTAGFGTNCTRGTNATGPALVSVTGGTWTFGNTYPQLSATLNTASYQWKSMAFQMPSTNAYFVVTFIPPATISASNPLPGYVQTATGRLLNTTESDLLQQFRHTSLPLQAYGTASTVGGVRLLVLPPFTSGGATYPVSYTIPTTVPDGSLVIISSPGLCAGC